MSRRITIDPITRLEGHGKVEILLDEQGNGQHAFLQVPELRGFERFCVGRPAEEMPQLTAHVCGVCPAAHHLASVRALDQLYGVEATPAARVLQALYYNLFIFEDHLLHYWYMGGPDFLVGHQAPAPMRNVLGVMAAVGQSLGRRILTVRKEARDLMAAISGRTVHPVFALPGGCSRALPPEVVAQARAAGPRLVAFAEETLGTFRQAVLENATWMRAVSSEVFRVRTHAMGMVDGDGRLAFLDGTLRVIDPDGAETARFEPARYLDHVAERVEPWTYAKLTFLKQKGWTGFTEGTESGLPADAVIQLVESLPLDALRGLEGFDRIWVLFRFHRSQGWAPLVRPPRKGAGRLGVLATRSPHRPNALGLSAVELLEVDGRTLKVRGVDFLDGTPVLDIKPYVPYADAFPEARAGWIDAVDEASGRNSAPGPRRPRRNLPGRDAAPG